MTKKGGITWEAAKTACRRNNVKVSSRGSEAKLSKVLPNGKKAILVIQHECCGSNNDVVWIDYILAMQRKFGIPLEDFRRKAKRKK